MHQTVPIFSDSAKGDLLQRKASRWYVFSLLCLLMTLPVFVFVRPIWSWLTHLGSASFMFAAFGLGLVMAAGPVATVVFALGGLFFSVEASFVPSMRRRGLSDKLHVAAGVLVSFAPSIAALYPPVKAILTGYIGFRGPGQQYYRMEDPFGFWQATAFWLMGAVTLAFLASLYWRAKWKSRHAYPETGVSESPSTPN